MPLHPLTTQIVGSYTKPRWLLDHERTAALDDTAWRPDPAQLAEAKRDAARLSVYEQVRAGLAAVTDGEAQRASYDRHVFARLGGVSVAAPVKVAASDGTTFAKRKVLGKEVHTDLFFTRPRVIGGITWPGPLCVDELTFARSLTDKPVKAGVVGPLTASDRMIDEHYGAPDKVAFAVAEALQEELLAVERAGAALLQIDEPMFHFKLDAAKDYGVEAVNRMVRGLRTPTILHLCYGYANAVEYKIVDLLYGEAIELAASCDVTAVSIEYEQPRHGPDLLTSCGDKHVLLGLLDLVSNAIETAEHISTRLRAAADVVPPTRLHPSSDCGMWFLPREVVFGKISALVAGTRLFDSD